MTVWPQAAFSQRATWPPRAAVRQLSIALITFNAPRLTRPALASRQAEPWSRRMIEGPPVAGELIRRAFLWHRPGITPCVKTCMAATISE
jgi:hypothetical protein